VKTDGNELTGPLLAEAADSPLSHASRTGDSVSRWRGRLLVVAAALLWSTSGLFVKAAPVFAEWPEEIRGLLLAFWRAVFAALILSPFVRQRRLNWLLVPLGLFFVLMNLTYLSAMVLGTAANAIWLQYTAPAWVFFMSWLFFRESADQRDIMPLACAIAGVVVILFFEFRRVGVGAGGVPWGTVLGLISGLAYAGVLVFMRRLRGEDPAWLVVFNHVLVVAVLFPFLAVWGRIPSLGQLVVLMAFGSLQMALPYYLLIKGLKDIPSQEAVLIGLIEPLVMPLWVWLVWAEIPAFWTIVGGGIILFGLVIRYTFLEGSRPETAKDGASLGSHLTGQEASGDKKAATFSAFAKKNCR